MPDKVPPALSVPLLQARLLSDKISKSTGRLPGAECIRVFYAFSANFSLTFVSISDKSSGLSSRNSFAFSLPCPSFSSL